MRRFVVRRLISTIPVVYILCTLVFFMIVLIPNADPVGFMLGEADAELQARLHQQFGLDDPILVRYGRWLTSLARGDLGRSIRTSEPLNEVIRSRMGVSLQLAAGSLVVALLISLPVGIYSAARPNSLGDNLGTVLAVAGAAIPNFWLGILLILLFAVHLGWLPAYGYVPLTEDPLESTRRMILPMIMTGTVTAASTMRQTRSSLLEVLRQDYVRTAHAKGLSERVVLFRHALKNAFIPVVTVLGLSVANLLGGSAIAEIIFGLPGMGQFAVASAMASDVPAVQAVVLVYGLIVVLVNLVVDLTYGFLDPRIRYA